MNNHFHLVIETPKPNLVEGMKWFLGTYTSRFNRRHRVFGHLFSGRYKALVVDGSGNGYLKSVCDYVHLNPVRARLIDATERLESYVWSSYRGYARLGRRRRARAIERRCFSPPETFTPPSPISVSSPLSARARRLWQAAMVRTDIQSVSDAVGLTKSRFSRMVPHAGHVGNSRFEHARASGHGDPTPRNDLRSPRSASARAWARRSPNCAR